MNLPFRIHTLFFLLVVPFATGCSSGNKGKQNLIDHVENTDEAGTIESFNQIYHLYPSPGEMLGIIDMEDLNYNGGLLIPAGNFDRYMGSRAQTYILGAYMTDLAYAALFGMHEVTLDYLEVVSRLSVEIRVEEAISSNMVEKARENVEYLDSLYFLSNEAFMNILAYCEESSRSSTVVMLSAGAFIESLYLGVNLVDNYEDAGAMIEHLSGQKLTIDKFVTFAESVNQDDPNVSSTIEDLKKIKEIYDQLESGEEGENDVRTALSSEQFQSLKKVVTELRGQLVNG